ncbi:MAG: hypothetical protein E6J59_07810 [Deltaproteobacteria bacterium]|nr:MAG: hypothetical protein E6J59_07810 [Deltaproteobacteria bacterium]
MAMALRVIAGREQRGWLAPLGEADVLAPGAWVALEHRLDEAPAAPAEFAVVQSRRHGRTAVTLLARREGPR